MAKMRERYGIIRLIYHRYTYCISVYYIKIGSRMETPPVACHTLEESKHIDGHTFKKQYKEVRGGRQWSSRNMRTSACYPRTILDITRLSTTISSPCVGHFSVEDDGNHNLIFYTEPHAEPNGMISDIRAVFGQHQRPLPAIIRVVSSPYAVS